jgi:hypothetical protein
MKKLIKWILIQAVFISRTNAHQLITGYFDQSLIAAPG